MKLSDLVKLKIELKKYTSLDHVRTAATSVDNDVKALRSIGAGVKYDPQITDITKIMWRHLNKLNKEVQDAVDQIITDIDSQIAEHAKEYFAKGHLAFTKTVAQDRDEKSGRRLPLTNDIKNIILGRIQLYADWHYPGMEIGPHDGEFTSHLVACDPLYLVDVHRGYLDSTMSQFPPEYQNRLRPYCIGYQKNEKGLVELPQEQFGFVFSWNTFNYLPLDEIKKYLLDIFHVLHPGGTFLFSYNDGDSYNGARHVEFGGMSYMPKSLLTTIVEGYGFEITNSFGFETDWHNISWLEIKKPGTLSTIKAHQTLGIVKDNIIE